jgi:2-polyprenyl-3-methyl-5-hydroxy-6-metoxy-1,4-benzoquinol methylase
MNETQSKWNERWREKASTSKWQVDVWLQKVRPLLPEGRALDVACGVGRNALFLAEQQFAVTAIDISDEALVQLRHEAHSRDLSIETDRVDLEASPVLPKGPFDLVLVLFYLHRPLLPLLRELVRPGGVIALRTFSSAGPFSGGPDNPDIVLRPGELLELFADWEVLSHEEGLEPSRKGGSVAGIVARRPE